MKTHFLTKTPFPHQNKDLLASMLRVDFAGEKGAVSLYEGQITGEKREENKTTLEAMCDEERGHETILENWISKKHVRPSLPTKIWKELGYFFGYCASKMGSSYAMAQTEAIETVIAAHYKKQIQVLLEAFPQEEKLIACLQKLYADEIHHKEKGFSSRHKSLLIDLWRALTSSGTCIAIAIAKRI